MISSNYLALVWLGFFAAVFLGWYFYLNARNKERMALIEKGADVYEIYKRESKFRFPWLKIGIVIIGFALGVLVDFIVIEDFNAKDIHFAQSYTPISMAIYFLFIGISILIAYFVDKPKNN